MVQPPNIGVGEVETTLSTQQSVNFYWTWRLQCICRLYVKDVVIFLCYDIYTHIYIYMYVSKTTKNTPVIMFEPSMHLYLTHVK